MVLLEYTDDRLVGKVSQNTTINFDPNSINNDWVSTTSFYINILFYLIYCSFISTMRFSGYMYVDTLNKCIEGSMYES